MLALLTHSLACEFPRGIIKHAHLTCKSFSARHLVVIISRVTLESRDPLEGGIICVFTIRGCLCLLILYISETLLSDET